MFCFTKFDYFTRHNLLYLNASITSINSDPYKIISHSNGCISSASIYLACSGNKKNSLAGITKIAAGLKEKGNCSFPLIQNVSGSHPRLNLGVTWYDSHTGSSSCPSSQMMIIKLIYISFGRSAVTIEVYQRWSDHARRKKTALQAKLVETCIFINMSMYPIIKKYWYLLNMNRQWI